MDKLIESFGEVCVLPPPSGTGHYLLLSIPFREGERRRQKTTLAEQKYSRQREREAERQELEYQTCFVQVQIDLAFHTPTTVGSWLSRWFGVVEEYDLETIFWGWCGRFPPLSSFDWFFWQEEPLWRLIFETDETGRGVSIQIRALKQRMIPNKLGNVIRQNQQEAAENPRPMRVGGKSGKARRALEILSRCQRKDLYQRTVTMLRATEICIYPTPEQAAFLNAQFGAVCFTYNKALHIRGHAYQRHGVNLSPRNDLKPLSSVAEKFRKYAWFKEFDSMALQQAIINISATFSSFFNPKLRARFPMFKRKHGKRSSHHCVGVKVLDNAIKAPKLASIEARLHYELHGKLKSITVTCSTTGEYYASILCNDGVFAPEKPAYLKEGKITGLDMGPEHYAITSDAVRIPNSRHLINVNRNL